MCVVSLFDIGADITQNGSKAIQTNELIFQAGRHDILPFLYDIRRKTAQTVTGFIDLDSNGRSLHYLTALAVLADTMASFIFIEMTLQLAFKHRIDQFHQIHMTNPVSIIHGGLTH